MNYRDWHITHHACLLRSRVYDHLGRWPVPGPGLPVDALPGLVLALPDSLGVAVHVVRDRALTVAGERLHADGWLQRGLRWARFGAGSAEQLDLVAAGQMPSLAGPLGLDDELLLRAFCAPVAGSTVPAEVRARVHERTAQDPSVWLRAFRRAEPLGLGHRVVALQNAYETGLPLGGGPVVALSGLDGAGKTTQAHLLAVALHALGYDVAVEWARVGFSPGLAALMSPLRAAVPRRRTQAAQEASPIAADAFEQGARRDRRRPPWVDGPWSVLVARWDCADARRRQAQHTAAGRVAVRDRYLLDSLVHVSDRYGGGSTTAAARGLLVRGMPAATCALLLELPPATAFARKPGEWSLPDLERHAASYDEVADSLDVLRVDATLPVHELAALIGAQVWLRLP